VKLRWPAISANGYSHEADDDPAQMLEKCDITGLYSCSTRIRWNR